MSSSRDDARTLFVLPAETVHHSGTMMAWPTASSISHEAYVYQGSEVGATRAELAAVAKAIAKYEHVHMFVKASGVGEVANIEDDNLKSAREILGEASNITIHETANVHSLWARDTGPLFVRSKEGLLDNTWKPTDDPGLGMNTASTSSNVVGTVMTFNNWGRKNNPNPDMFLAPAAAQALKKSSTLAPFIAEGGAIEVDGEGTLIATESSILNPNRNPGISKAAMERHFAQSFGIEKIIWIPGVRGADITDDHIDALVRFASPSVVLLSKASRAASGSGRSLDSYHDAKRILSEATDAQGRRLKIVDVPEPDPKAVLGEGYDPESGPCVSYVNYLVVNGGVVMSKFGDAEKDAEAARIIGEHYPGRNIEQVYLHQLAMQGGGIHCSTQQIPA